MNVQQALNLHKNDEVTIKAHGFVGTHVKTVSYIQPEFTSPRDAVPAHLEVVDAAREILKKLDNMTNKHEMENIDRRLRLAIGNLPVCAVVVFMTDGSKYYNSDLA